MKMLVAAVALVVLAVAVIAADPPHEEMFKNNMKECLTQLDVTEAQFKSGQVPKDKICVYKCMKEKVGLMNAAGEITLDEFKAKRQQPAQLINNIEACVPTSKKADPCETAKALSDCLKQKWKPS